MLKKNYDSYRCFLDAHGERELCDFYVRFAVGKKLKYNRRPTLPAGKVWQLLRNEIPGIPDDNCAFVSGLLQ